MAGSFLIMKLLLLLVSIWLCGCAHVQRPYIKESILNKDGTTTTREYSADWMKGLSLKSLITAP